MGKRKSDSEESIRKKIRKLEEKLKKKGRNRIRILSSSEDENQENLNDIIHLANTEPESSSNDNNLPPTSEAVPAEEVILDKEILDLLGEAPQIETILGKPIHTEISLRWCEIIEKGITKEIKEKLYQDYLIPSNCTQLIPPKLNAEIRSALSESTVKRDITLTTKQRQVGIALAALSKSMQMVISKETSPQKVLTPLKDACRLLCDILHNENKTRRHFVISAIKPDMKEVITDTKVDAQLFGEDIAEKLKQAKSIKRSASELRPNRPFRPFNVINKNNFAYKPNNLNDKAPQRMTSTMGRNVAGRPRLNQQRPFIRGGFQQREVRERSPPPSRHQPPPYRRTTTTTRRN